MSAHWPPRKIRVVVLIDSLLNPGGGESLAVEAAIQLDPHRFERTLCITRWDQRLRADEPGRSLIERAEDAGVRVIGLDRTSPLALTAWKPLYRLLRDERVDVIHGHMFGSNLWAVVIGLLARVPVRIAHEHMWDYSGGRIRSFLDRELIARGSSAFIAVSGAGLRSMIEVEKIPERRLVLIENAVAATPPGKVTALSEELGFDPMAPVVTSVGNLRPEKAFSVLVESMALLRQQHPSARAVIAGEGECRDALAAQIAELGLEEVVTLIGFRRDVQDVLASSRIAVCCSDSEGGPLSVMEYMNAGLPVVATEVGGLPELVLPGQTGLLVPPRDPSALASAIGGLLDDPARARAMGEAGRQSRAGRDLGSWAHALQDLYQDRLRAAGAL